MTKFPLLFPVVSLTLRLSVLVLPLPAFATTSSPIASCTKPEVQALIGKLASAGDEQERAIATLSQCNNAAEPLIWHLENNPNVQARSAAVAVLERMGAPAVEGLVQLVGDRTRPEVARSLAIDVLSQMAQAEKTASAEQLKIVELLTQRSSDPQESALIQLEATRALRQIRSGAGRSATGQPGVEQIRGWVEQNPQAAGGIGLVGAIAVFYLLAFWLNPRLYSAMIPAQLKIEKLGIDVPIGVLRWLKYQPRVLDRWVEEWLTQYSSKFLETPAVEKRKIHIPLPVRFGGEDILLDAKNKKLKETFRKEDESCLLIWGAGGTGKTSPACQIARWGAGLKTEEQDDQNQAERLCQHRMFPVLIDRDLEEDISLLTAIRQELPNWESIDEELLKVLLQKKRILVIIDHVSELDAESTYPKIARTLTETPIKALILTSRPENKDLGRKPTKLKALEIKQDKLSGFINAYLKRKARESGKTEQDLKDSDFYQSCQKLSDMVADTLRSTTVLLARIYADEIFANWEKQGRLIDHLPENIPDLILSYLDRLSAAADEMTASETDKQNNRERIRRDAKAIAWECLKNDYRPTDVSHEEVRNRLADFSDKDKPEEKLKDADDCLTNLEERVRILHPAGSSGRVKIILDPVAEYLAALYLVDDLCQGKLSAKHPAERTEAELLQQWNDEFFNQLEQKQYQQPPLDVQGINGFLVAVYNCCQTYPTRNRSGRVPESVLNRLQKLADLKPEELKRIKEQRQVNNLINILQDAPDDDYRARVARDLGAMGAAAKIAVPTLWKIVEKDSEQGWVRRSAAFALKQLGQTPPEFVVKLAQVEDKVIEKIELLAPAQVVQADLGEGVALEMVQIPAGRFWMGSPEGEKTNDSELPRHEVTIGKSFWMGKYPVTQAQWKTVAGLPKVNIDLDPDPSRFKGNNRPVEFVSWRAAVEFCDRLSQKTNQNYRLPTEAEWEYACRAKTETLYSFGDKITPVLANYNDSRMNETTPVGYFGVANSFGLYDMHGNVWEWCADHWHENYQDAPSDGSAWLTNDKEARRLMRGGSWYFSPGYCRAACRDYGAPDYRSHFFLGFRVVCVFS
jgi:formylglycine-generating enzyme required for sulfatase activity